ncbi:MAG TPA: glucuronate isomerase [Clostridiales bacterium]|nr:glucuronate isomerase [Clostridiales bacterium]
MNNDYLLNSETAKRLYESIRYLPIYDYHCHLSPQEIYEDRPFENIGKLWLGHDHYKWRLMRAYGIDEENITGQSDWKEKFLAYAEVIELAANNPLYHWTQMELKQFFAIDEPLNIKTAEEIWNKTNQIIKIKQLSPRKCIEQSNVKYIASTDDICDTLEFHIALRKEGYPVTVSPSFRTDKLLLIRSNDYNNYINKLSEITDIKIDSLSTLKEAIKSRLLFFREQGCKFSDVGIPFFPDEIASETEAEKIFTSVLAGKEISESEFLSFLGNMYFFLGKLYKENGIVMQWHLAVERNANINLFNERGADVGGDCIGDIIPIKHIIKILDAISKDSGLPQTILYTLNPIMLEPLASAAGCFRNVRIGAAWWFNDHKKGIEQTLETVSNSMHLAKFLGMLTDSRSFLSYVRHDYFRRILCSVVNRWVVNGEFIGDFEKLCKDISCGNIERLIREGL